MAPLTKDSLEVAGSSTEIQANRNPPQPKQTPAAGQLRADALSLEIPVKVHGSRISTAPVGAAPRTEPFEEQTSTMIVFPQGGVIRMSTSVNIGQMLVVTNLKTRQDAICRVVKVRTFTNMQGYVEVEFTHKQEGYWGVQVSANSSAPAATTHSNPPAVATLSPARVSVEPVVTQPQKSIFVPVPPPAAPVVVAQEVVAVVDASPVVVPPSAVVAPPVAQVSYVAPLTPPTFVPPPPPPAPLAPVVAPVVPVAHITPPAPPAAPKQENPFVSIGTQEQVQPAASATATIKPGLPALSTRPAVPVRQAPIVEAPVPETPKIEFPNMQDTEIVAPFEEVSAPAMSNVQSFTSSPAAAPLTLSELRGDEPTPTVNASVEAATATLEQAPLAEEKPAESSRAVFGSLSGGGFGSNRAASKESFGARLDGGLGSSDEPKREGRSSNWMLIAACVSVLFAGIVGGAFYLRSQSSGAAANGSSSAQSTQQSQQVAAEQDALQNSASRTAVSGPMATVVPSSVPAVTVSANASNSTAKPNLVAKPPVSKTAALMDSATIEHPLTAQRTDALVSAAAPSFDVPAPESSNGNALPGVISSSSMANPAVPEIRTEGPVVIGGQVAEPKLLYRAMPVYPLGAKQSGVQGDVVIKTTVDQKGSVVDMHVVSGPAMLRQAALDALRRWKYEPSKLNGQPISVQMLVTLKFSR